MKMKFILAIAILLALPFVTALSVEPVAFNVSKGTALSNIYSSSALMLNKSLYGDSYIERIHSFPIYDSSSRFIGSNVYYSNEVDVAQELALLRQAVYELNSELEYVKAELCSVRIFGWCVIK